MKVSHKENPTWMPRLHLMRRKRKYIRQNKLILKKAKDSGLDEKHNSAYLILLQNSCGNWQGDAPIHYKRHYLDSRRHIFLLLH